MITVTEHKPSGISTRTLTNAEVDARAARGDITAIRDWAKRKGKISTFTLAEIKTLLGFIIGEE